MNKYSIGAIALGVAVVSVSLVPLAPALGAVKTKKVSVVGMAKFTAKGSVVDVSTSSFTLHTSSVTKNAAFFKAKDQTILVGTGTKITKGGKKFAFSKLTKGTKVKVFGVFDKKSNSIIKVTWIKVSS